MPTKKPNAKKPNAKKPSAAVRRAAAAFLNRTFVDPITLSRVGKSRGVVMNKQMYDVRTMQELVRRGNYRVPHSRRRIAPSELWQFLNTPPRR